MRPVADEDGRPCLLLLTTDDGSDVRDLETGQRRAVPTDSLSVLEADPLVAVAAGDDDDPVPEPLASAPPGLARGILLELYLGGPRPVRTLLGETSLCESDLHGVVADLRAAGLVREFRVDGERGYGLTEAADEALSTHSE
jgi:hypothetical protein